jgi:hypothetical protein
MWSWWSSCRQRGAGQRVGLWGGRRLAPQPWTPPQPRATRTPGQGRQQGIGCWLARGGCGLRGPAPAGLSGRPPHAPGDARGMHHRPRAHLQRWERGQRCQHRRCQHQRSAILELHLHRAHGSTAAPQQAQQGLDLDSDRPGFPGGRAQLKPPHGGVDDATPRAAREPQPARVAAQGASQRLLGRPRQRVQRENGAVGRHACGGAASERVDEAAGAASRGKDVTKRRPATALPPTRYETARQIQHGGRARPGGRAVGGRVGGRVDGAAGAAGRGKDVTKRSAQRRPPRCPALPHCPALYHIHAKTGRRGGPCSNPG